MSETMFENLCEWVEERIRDCLGIEEVVHSDIGSYDEFRERKKKRRREEREHGLQVYN